MENERITIEDEWRGPYPKHMQEVSCFIENPFFGSYEIEKPCVFLHFKGYDVGDFFLSGEQTLLSYVKKWKPCRPERLSEEKVDKITP